VEDIAKWELGNHGYLICLEIMAELAGCNQHHVQQPLYLWVPSLRLIQDFADEVNWSLNLVCMSSLLVLNDNSHADNPRSHHDVD
jgi:hypothetical protein